MSKLLSFEPRAWTQTPSIHSCYCHHTCLQHESPLYMSVPVYRIHVLFFNSLFNARYLGCCSNWWSRKSEDHRFICCSSSNWRGGQCRSLWCGHIPLLCWRHFRRSLSTPFSFIFLCNWLTHYNVVFGQAWSQRNAYWYQVWKNSFFFLSFYPTRRHFFTKIATLIRIMPEKPGDHGRDRLHELFQQSLKALKGNKIRVLYLHAPDRSVPYEETLKAVDELYRAGHLWAIFFDENFLLS